MKRRFSSLCLTLLLMFSLVACGNPNFPSSNSNSGSGGANSEANTTTDSTSGEQFLIGTYLQLTGNNSAAGITAMNGIDLAVKQINEQGGFNGAQVVVEHFDTTGSTE